MIHNNIQIERNVSVNITHYQIICIDSINTTNTIQLFSHYQEELGSFMSKWTGRWGEVGLISIYVPH